MENERNKNQNFEINNFLGLLVKLYMGQVRRENYFKDDSATSIYLMAKQMIDKKEEENPKENDYSQMREILEKFYLIMQSTDARDIILKNNLKEAQMKKYFQMQILGNTEKEYDVSNLYREDYIMKSEDRQFSKTGRKIAYMQKSCVQHEYMDEKGNKVHIKEIGRLYIEEWNGVKRDIPKYRIQRQVRQNEYLIDEVYSNIQMIYMDDPEYRRVVLNELLSDKNISLPNTGGYIGEVVETPKEMKDENSEPERSISHEYYRKINQQYSLRYDAVDLTAAVLQSKSLEEKGER